MAEALRQAGAAGGKRPWSDEEKAFYIYNSNAIERNPLSLEETRRLLEGGALDGYGEEDREVLEVLRHRDALELVLGLAAEGRGLREETARLTHQRLWPGLPEFGGEYRTRTVWILGAAEQPPSPWEVRERVEALFEEYRFDRPYTLEEIARFHLRFEGIHPFVDGNGRVGRLLLEHMLLWSGFGPAVIRVEARERYYQAFDEWARTKREGALAELIRESFV